MDDLKPGDIVQYWCTLGNKQRADGTTGIVLSTTLTHCKVKLVVVVGDEWQPVMEAGTVNMSKANIKKIGEMPKHSSDTQD